jgi:hypothetical protein
VAYVQNINKIFNIPPVKATKATLDQPLTLSLATTARLVRLPIILHFIFYPIAFHHASSVRKRENKKHQQHLNFTHKWLLLLKMGGMLVVVCEALPGESRVASVRLHNRDR